jgi:WD40 repeat protein
VFSPDGQWLAAGGNDGAIRLLSVRDRREVGKTPAHKNTVYCVTFNPTGTLLASAGFDDTIHIWEVRTSKTDPER